MPFARERHIVFLVLPLEPDRRRREAFLPQRIDRDDPVSPGVLVDVLIDMAILGDWLLRHTRDRLPRPVNARRLHAVNAIALDALLRVLLPLEMARRPVLLREHPLRRRRDRQ